MVPTGANGQPAVATYAPDPAGGGARRLHTPRLFTVTAPGTSHTVVFQDPVDFATFALPATLES